MGSGEEKRVRPKTLREEEVSKRAPSFQILQRSWLREAEAQGEQENKI